MRFSACASRSTSTHIAARASGSSPVVGLVEEEHLRLVNEAERDVEPALHPARVAARLPVGRVAQPDELEQLIDARLQRLARHAVDATLEEQVLAPGRFPVDAGVLRDVPEHAAHAGGVRDDVLAADERAARSRAASASSARAPSWTSRHRSGRAARTPHPRAPRTTRRRAPARPCSSCGGPRRRSRPLLRV